MQMGEKITDFSCASSSSSCFWFRHHLTLAY